MAPNGKFSVTLPALRWETVIKTGKGGARNILSSKMFPHFPKRDAAEKGDCDDNDMLIGEV